MRPAEIRQPQTKDAQRTTREEDHTTGRKPARTKMKIEFVPDDASLLLS
jgi:hypothetical protein